MLESGIHDIGKEEYHADPCPDPSLSSSIAKIVCSQSPAHARLQHPKLTSRDPSIPTAAMDLGSAVHALILQPDIAEDMIAVVEADSWRTKASREERDFARENDLIPLLPAAHETALAMATSARVQLAAHSEGEVFQDGRVEQTLIWKENNGIWCRSRLDWLSRDHHHIDDFKTTATGASPHQISRRALDHGWDIQAAFYLRGLRFLDPDADPSIRFVVQESTPPYALVVAQMGGDTLFLGNEKVEHAIEVWGNSLSSGQWEGYSQTTVEVRVPQWEETRWLDKIEDYDRQHGKEKKTGDPIPF